MFVVGLKKTEVWVTMALLVLWCSIRLHSCYPHADEDEDPTGAKENLGTEDDHEQDLDQVEDEEALEEEQALLHEAADVEDAPTIKPDENCRGFLKYCDSRNKCCRKKGEELKCDSEGICVSDFSAR